MKNKEFYPRTNCIKTEKCKLVWGFTLVELMIAVAILAIILLGLLAVFTSCFKLNETSRNLTVAINGAQKKIEEIRNSTFSSVYSIYNGAAFEVDGLDNSDSEGSIMVDNTNPALLEVTVTVCWRQKGGRIIGEDNGGGGGIALDGKLNGTEDTNVNNILDSPAQIVTLMTRR